MEMLHYAELEIIMFEGIAKDMRLKSKLSFNHAFKTGNLTHSEFIAKFCNAAKFLSNEVK